MLESVAEIFFPICPDLPTPITINLPLQEIIELHNRLKLESNCLDRSEIASDSILNVLIADAL